MYAEGRVRRLAVALAEALEGFETMAPRVADRVPPMRDYDRFTEVLGFFTGAGCAGCRAGGSQLPFCAARTCFREQGVDFCFQCAEYPCGRNAYPENLARRWRAAGDRMREVGAEEFYRTAYAAALLGGDGVAPIGGSVLVGFATRYGSTQEVAEAVAEALRGEGLHVDVKPLREVRSLDGYQAAVVGAPLQMFRWHKDALGFLKRHRRILEAIPVAVFALGPLENSQKHWGGARSQLEEELAKFPWLKPATVKVFGGKLDPCSLRFPYNVTPGLNKLPPSDLRSWDDIETWGRSLPGVLFGEAD
jgi:menaquinone-dependent protoporphyrinogen oxidase